MQYPIGYQRFESMDILRGFALLGILLMNIRSYSMHDAAYFNPTAMGDFEGWNVLVWLFTMLFADAKFVTLFSMLFGCGVALYFHKWRSDLQLAKNTFRRKMLFLFLFGYLHFHFLWGGDILASYAICGLILIWLVSKPPKSLIRIGITLFIIESLFLGLIFSIGAYVPEDFAAEIVEEFQFDWQPDTDEIDEDIADQIAPFWDRFSLEGPLDVLTDLPTHFFGSISFMILGLMCFGMALFKQGFFTLRWQTTSYFKLAGKYVVIGLSLSSGAILVLWTSDFDYVASNAIGLNLITTGAVFTTIAYAAFMLGKIKQGNRYPIFGPLSLLGKMSLTQYLLQSVICVLLFNQFGLYGQFSRAEQILIVLFVWIIQLALAYGIHKIANRGPMEWLHQKLVWGFR